MNRLQAPTLRGFDHSAAPRAIEPVEPGLAPSAELRLDLPPHSVSLLAFDLEGAP